MSSKANVTGPDGVHAGVPGDDDTEGHRGAAQVVADDGGPDDVQARVAARDGGPDGHKHGVVPGDEDTEGHRAAAQVVADDTDTEGHKA